MTEAIDDLCANLRSLKNPLGSGAADEIARLQSANSKLRDALAAAQKHIGNGYQPPELMDQIDAALSG